MNYILIPCFTTNLISAAYGTFPGTASSLPHGIGGKCRKTALQLSEQTHALCPLRKYIYAQHLFGEIFGIPYRFKVRLPLRIGKNILNRRIYRYVKHQLFNIIHVLFYVKSCLTERFLTGLNDAIFQHCRHACVYYTGKEHERSQKYSHIRHEKAFAETILNMLFEFCYTNHKLPPIRHHIIALIISDLPENSKIV